MDMSMHGDILPLEVLSPKFKYPSRNLKPEHWAQLAIEAHAELTGFPKGADTIVGVINYDSYTRVNYVGNKYRDVVGDNAQREILPDIIDDSRCSETIKDLAFVPCLTFGRRPNTEQWQMVKFSRSRKPNSTTKLKHPKSRRTLHLIISARGFFIVYVYWKSYAEWYKFPARSGWGIANCGFRTERMVVSEAGAKEIASFLRNKNKTFRRRPNDEPDNAQDSRIAFMGMSILDKLEDLQKQVAGELLKPYKSALRARRRIKRTIKLLK